MSITSLDRSVARAMEPRAATPPKRLETVRRLSEAGIPVTVMVAPIIPGLTDHEIEPILEAARDAGARDAGYVLAAPAARDQGPLSRVAAAKNSPTEPSG